MRGNVRYCCFFEEWYCPASSQKIVVLLSRLKCRIIVLPTVLLYYRITVLLVRSLQLVTACYSLLRFLSLVTACYRLLPLVTACYSIMCYVLNDYYTSSRTGEYQGYGIVGQLLVDLVVAVGRSK